MEPSQLSSGLVCTICQRSVLTGLQAILVPCGNTVCIDCNATPHCSRCSAMKIEPYQKTVVLQNFFQSGSPVVLQSLVTLPSNLPEISLSIPSQQCSEKDLEHFFCSICFDIFHDPITVNCGHSFCRSCLARAIDHKPSCPVCRAPLPQYSTQQSRPNDLLILHLCKSLFPTAFTQRQESELKRQTDLENDLPIFVCNAAFPKIQCHLHVFEPRYRLMMRRAMEGERVFGMVKWKRSGGPSDYGTLLRIEELTMLPDGRSLISTVGVRKFKIIEKGEKDGYMTGKVEFLDDPEGFDRNSSPGKEIVDRFMEISRTFIGGLSLDIGQRLSENLGPAPFDDPVVLTYWILSLFTDSLPDSFIEEFYRLVDPVDRIKLLSGLLIQLMENKV